MLRALFPVGSTAVRTCSAVCGWLILRKPVTQTAQRNQEDNAASCHLQQCCRYVIAVFWLADYGEVRQRLAFRISGLQASQKQRKHISVCRQCTQKSHNCGQPRPAVCCVPATKVVHPRPMWVPEFFYVTSNSGATHDDTAAHGALLMMLQRTK